MNRPLSKWALFAAAVAAGVLADQSTKILAVDRLTVAFPRAGAHTLAEKVGAYYRTSYLEPLSTGPAAVFRPWWQMSYVENPGAAWGLFRGHSPRFRIAFFGLITLGAAGFILWYLGRVGERQRALQLALALVLAGAVGNFIDRLAHGYVVDFVEWYWWNRPDLRWPTFNVADSCITVGVVLLLLHPGARKEEGQAARN